MDLITKYVLLQIQLISPICPHTAQHCLNIFKECQILFGVPIDVFKLKLFNQEVVNPIIIQEHACLKLFLKNMRQQFEKSTKRSRPKGKKVEKKEEK
jgi:hypothetical protein